MDMGAVPGGASVRSTSACPPLTRTPRACVIRGDRVVDRQDNFRINVRISPARQRVGDPQRPKDPPIRVWSLDHLLVDEEDGRVVHRPVPRHPLADTAVGAEVVEERSERSRLRRDQPVALQPKRNVERAVGVFANDGCEALDGAVVAARSHTGASVHLR
jgi:hypothetical protein